MLFLTRYKLGLQWHVPESNNYTHIGDMLFPKMVGCIVKKWGVTGRNYLGRNRQEYINKKNQE